jgi:hypothetical protein
VLVKARLSGPGAAETSTPLAVPVLMVPWWTRKAGQAAGLRCRLQLVHRRNHQPWGIGMTWSHIDLRNTMFKCTIQRNPVLASMLYLVYWKLSIYDSRQTQP